MGPADAPGFDVGGQNDSVFEVCRRSCTFGANFVRTQQNTVKTDTRGTSEFSRDKTKPTKNRSEDAFEAARCSAGARTAHREGLGASSGCPARLLDGSWPLLARPGRPKIGFGAAFGRPKAVPSGSGRVSETAWALETAQDRFFVDFGSVWGGFSSSFGRFFVDLRSSRVRRRHKSRISKKSRVILSARLGSCVVDSLCTARTSFEVIFEHCMFSLFSLRAHKPT